MPERDKATLKAIGIVALGAAGLWFWYTVASLVFWLYGFHAHGPFTYGALWKYANWYWGDPRVMPALKVAAAVPTLLAVAVGAVEIVRRIKKPKQTLYGETQFTDDAEIERRGFFPDPRTPAILIGKRGKRYLRVGGSLHIAIIAPTGSGKGVSYLIPNGLLWNGTGVFLDMKGDLYKKTAGARANAGQPVYRVDFLNPHGQTARWNPFFYVDHGSTSAYTDISQIIDLIIPETKASDPFWANMPRLTTTGVASYLSESNPSALTMAELARMFSDDMLRRRLSSEMEARRRAARPFTVATETAIKSILRLSDKEYSGIVSTIMSRLRLYIIPSVDAATSGNDFDLRELRHRKMAVYVTVLKEHLGLLAPVLALFFTQVIDMNSRSLFIDDSDARHQVTVFLDEFGNLPAMPKIVDSVTLLRDYGVRLLLSIQSTSQLIDLYGDASARTLLGNCDVKVYFKTDDDRDLKNLSERLGFNTVKGFSNTRQRGMGGNRGPSETQNDHRRALMLPQELRHMADDDVLILAGGGVAFIAKRVFYYDDPLFVGLVIDPPVVRPIGLRIPRLPAPEKRDDEDGGNAPASGGPPEPPRKPPGPGGAAAGDERQQNLFEPDKADAFIKDLFGGKNVDLSQCTPADAKDLLSKVIGEAATKRGRKGRKAA